MTRKFLVCFLFAAGVVIWVGIDTHGPDTSSQREEQNSPYLKPVEEFYFSRGYPDAFNDPKVFQAAMQDVRQRAILRSGQDRFDAPWTIQGPGNIGARINTIAVHPYSPDIMLAGFSAGGIFRTENGGESWEPVFDDQPTLAIGDIAFDPVNPDIVFAGTGDPNIGGYPFIGAGVFKSTDSGKSWSYSGLSKVGVVSKIEVHPLDPDIVFCSAMGFPFYRSADRGLYKSTNGGETWEQVLFLSDSTGVSDFLLHPDNPDLVMACGWDRIRNNAESIISGNGARIYRSDSGGDSWEMLSNGLPMGRFSRTGLAYFPGNPDIAYAIYIGDSPEAGCAGNDLQLAGIFRTDDFGDHWSAIPTSEVNGLNCNALGNFGWYFAKIRVGPENPDELYLLGIDLWHTSNGGGNWDMASPPWWQYRVHADKHDLVFVADSMVLATDGGLYKAAQNDFSSWRDIENIPATQFYRVGYNPHDPDRYFGGAQDNGTTGGNAGEINTWPRIFGADGFQPLFDREDPLTFFVETQRGGVYYTEDGGADFNSFGFGLDPGSQKYWDMPFVMSHHRSNLLYAGGKALYRARFAPDSQWEQASPDLTKGDTLPMGRYPALTAIAESPLDSNILYVGTQDGKVWTSKNYGEEWMDITPGLPDRFVTSLVCSPIDPLRVFVSHSGYRDGDHIAYIHVSEDGGNTWMPFSDDMPEIAVNNVLIYPERQDSVVFAATDGGVYATVDYGTTWERVGSNMPYIPVYDVEYNPDRNEIVAGTHARGIQSFPLDSVSLDLEDPVSKVRDQPDALTVSVFPTVVDRYVHIDLTSISGPVRLGLYDFRGRQLDIEKKSGGELTRYVLPDHAVGVLVLQVITSRGSKVFTLVRPE